jgi:ATP-dependent Clp protease ATP-binding subunit ClpA
MKCIGATTYDEYRTVFEKERALSRRFQKIDVPEPTPEETYQILKGLKPAFEDHHDVKYTLPALRKVVELTSRYMTDRHLPDKAIDVLDEAGARQRILPASKRRKTIGVPEIEQMVAEMARIPVSQVSGAEKDKLKGLDQQLGHVVFGQTEAIDALSTSLKMARAGLKDPEKPIASFLFAGPTGVGKTEICRQLGRLVGMELIRFDMSEYMERHAVSRLIGAPPGYVGYEAGGLLTEAVNKHPHAIVLLDEIEKAHPDIFNLLLQVMDHGSLTDNNGRKADFRNVLLVMTSNVGAEVMGRSTMGFVEQEHKKDFGGELKKLFTPEFRNRLDAVVQFNPLSREIIGKVVDKNIIELEEQLKEKKIRIDLSATAREWLMDKGYEPAMGARPMRRLIQEQVRKPLADLILFGELGETGGLIKVDLLEDKLKLTIS